MRRQSAPDLNIKILGQVTFLLLCMGIWSLPSLSYGQESRLAQTENQPDEAAACYRPAPPNRADFPDRASYVAGLKTYYRAASVYISNCLDRWIADTRLAYARMAEVETQAYQDERNDVLRELRGVAQSTY